MKQGIFTNSRIKLLLAPGAKGYRAKRTGERVRKSVRGCVVGPDIKNLSVTITKKGEKEMMKIFQVKVHHDEVIEEKAKNLSFKERLRIEAQLKREIEELFHGRNLD